MKKITHVLFLFLFSLLLSSSVFAQNSDFGRDSKSGVTANYGITQEELSWLNSKPVIQDREIPLELLDQLEQARQNVDLEESNRINDIINSQYRIGIKNINSDDAQNSIPLPEPIIGDLFSNEYDWLPGDVLVAADTGGGAQFPRTLDLKLGDDGNLYLACVVNTPTQRRINVYKSTNGGQNWTFKGGVWYSSPVAYFQTLSMLVESKSVTIEDSIRVIVYYTSSTNSNNDDASLKFFQFKPNATNPEYMIKNLESPSPGREFNYVSALSDGQYYTSATYYGCVVGEYSNSADTSISHRVFRTTTWGDTHSSVTLDTYSSSWNDKYPVVSFKAANGGDSLYIVTERDFPPTSPTQSQVRIIIAPWTISTVFKTNFLTVGPGIFYKKPVIAIKQSPRSIAKRMMITCTKDGEAKYHYSVNSGDSWDTDLFLQTGTPSVNTNYTYISSDSSGTSADFCAMFSQRNGAINADSINIRRGIPGSMGTTLYQQNSQRITTTHPAVTAIYRDGGNLKSAFAYWGNGPDNVYFDAENLVSDVKDIPGTVKSYSLEQNYPNPFNPNTTIRFSIPEQANVTLKIYNTIGQEVATLLNREIAAGNHSVDFNANKLSSGVYFYSIEAGDFKAVRKMMLMK